MSNMIDKHQMDLFIFLPEKNDQLFMVNGTITAMTFWDPGQAQKIKFWND